MFMINSIAAVLALMLSMSFCGVSLAETAEPKPIVGNVQENIYTLQIPMAEGDQGTWAVEENEYVSIKSTEMSRELLTYNFVSLKDGETTIAIRHLTDNVCDQLHTFDFRIQNGVFESIGGSYTESPRPEDLEKALAGEWLEKDTQFTQMTITRGEDSAFAFEIASPVTHGAFIYKGTMRYDCQQNAFVCEDGAAYNVPITEEENPDLSEPVRTDCTSKLTIAGEDEEHIELVWENQDGTEPQRIVFAR